MNKVVVYRLVIVIVGITHKNSKYPEKKGLRSTTSSKCQTVLFQLWFLVRVTGMSVCNKNNKKQVLQQSGVFYTCNKLLPEGYNVNTKMQLFRLVNIQQ